MNPIEPIEQEPQANQLQENQERAPREWIEPSFERMTLKEALSSPPHPTTTDDGITDYS